ncbi:MAG: hypothetical protein J0I99_15160 [Devosia sp.]|uniref:hypothetical protein n=1 Tax=Devosia sp. TaxID=1871048 RepID=UPI001AC967CA|nr:hypothetical protein [Devosia sp.]MBN9317080.1 hypothetical protein [Devosia sp.]
MTSLPDQMDAIHTLLVRWKENDPLYSVGYRSKKKSLGARLLKHEAELESLPKPAEDALLYRAFDLKKAHRLADGSLSIIPRSIDLIDSWTVDAGWAIEHANQFENGVVMRMKASDLSVLVDVDAFADAVGDENLSIEGEVLVRSQSIVVPQADWTWSEDDFPENVPSSTPKM